MKTYLIALIIASLPTFANATEYCKASQETVSKIDELRIVELPYKVVELQIVKALIADKCVRSKLQNEEIYNLTQSLLNFNNSGETASSIIGEFIAL